MKRILTFSAFALILSFAVPAAAECVRPGEPELPSGATATKSAMVAAVKSVHNYQKALVDFRSCLDQEKATVIKDVTDEKELRTLSERYNRRYNASVDAEEAFVNRFNEEIRAYKNQTASKK